MIQAFYSRWVESSPRRGPQIQNGQTKLQVPEYAADQVGICEFSAFLAGCLSRFLSNH